MTSETSATSTLWDEDFGLVEEDALGWVDNMIPQAKDSLGDELDLLVRGDMECSSPVRTKPRQEERYTPLGVRFAPQEAELIDEEEQLGLLSDARSGGTFDEYGSLTWLDSSRDQDETILVVERVPADGRRTWQAETEEETDESLARRPVFQRKCTPVAPSDATGSGSTYFRKKHQNGILNEFHSQTDAMRETPYYPDYLRKVSQRTSREARARALASAAQQERAAQPEDPDDQTFQTVDGEDDAATDSLNGVKTTNAFLDGFHSILSCGRCGVDAGIIPDPDNNPLGAPTEVMTAAVMGREGSGLNGRARSFVLPKDMLDECRAATRN